ncbi:MAG: N-acetylmuramoyl-L-alanine amidase [Bdellovibrionales bacterium]
MESKITLAVARQVAELLKKNKNFDVKMTRNSDVALTLKERAELALKNHGDLFVSIHANSSPDRRAKGAEFFFQNQLPPDSETMFLARRELHHHGHNTDEERLAFGPRHNNAYVASILEDIIRNRSIQESARLSESLVEEWDGTLKPKKHVIQQAPFYVISNVPMPSVLVELGFLTHQKEGKLLSTSAHQYKLANSIYKGILKFKESMDKPPR